MAAPLAPADGLEEVFVGEPATRPPRAFDSQARAGVLLGVHTWEGRKDTEEEEEEEETAGRVAATRFPRRLRKAQRRRSRPAEQLLTWVQCDLCHKWRSLPVDYVLPPTTQEW